MNQTPSKVIYMVVIAIGILDLLCVTTLCLSLFLHTYADASILTALIAVTSTLTGSLVTLLSSTRTQTPASGETTTSSTMTITSKPVEKPAEPTPVQVVNSPADPIPVEPTTTDDKK